MTDDEIMAELLALRPQLQEAIQQWREYQRLLGPEDLKKLEHLFDWHYLPMWPKKLTKRERKQWKEWKARDPRQILFDLAQFLTVFCGLGADELFNDGTVRQVLQDAGSNASWLRYLESERCYKGAVPLFGAPADRRRAAVMLSCACVFSEIYRRRHPEQN